MAARTHASDEHFGIERMALHADSVPEDGAAGKGRVGIGRDHTHRPAPLPQQGDNGVDQSRLSGARRARETGYMPGASEVAERLLELANGRVAALDEAYGSGQGPDVAGAKPLGQLAGWVRLAIWRRD